MNIEQKLVTSVISGLKALYGQDVPAAQVQLQKTKKEFEGHLTLVVFPFLRMSNKVPEQTAQEIGEYLQANEPSVAAFNVIKGFLNLTIASSAWIELLNGIHADKQYGIVAVTDNSPLVMIEYSSPNTNKPLHLGHVRNNLLGNALANIVAANGNKVVKTNIVNDRGIHICKSMLAWQKYGNGETPESSGKKGDHLIGDYYVSFDKHYKAEVKELMAKFQSEGMNEEEAKAKAEAESPLMKEAREMLVKWEANDPEVRAYLHVVMVENYNVTLAEKLIPAADIHEQISLASKEASGTSNMKFMLNGAVAIGTMDGANVEMHQLVGDDNIYIFGESSDEVIEHYAKADYVSRKYYDNDADIKRAIDFIVSDEMKAIGNAENLERLFNELINKDWFMTLPDFESYRAKKDEMLADYEDRKAWAKMMLTNISKAGFFSSDRTIEQYNKDIWKLD